jgi:hypothetical protein
VLKLQLLRTTLHQNEAGFFREEVGNRNRARKYNPNMKNQVMLENENLLNINKSMISIKGYFERVPNN